MQRSRWVIAVCFVGLLPSAPACSGNLHHESTDPVASCRLDDRDTEVLQTVLDEVVLGSGACAQPGLLLLYEVTVPPQFPATVEEERRRQEIDARLAAGEKVEVEELAVEAQAAEDADLRFSNGLTLDRATVRSTADRQKCSIGDLQALQGWSLAELGVETHDDLFTGNIPEGWRRLRKIYPEMTCLVKFSAPGYLEDSTRVVVSYSRMSGPLSGMGGFVVLRREGERWQVEWSESLWIS